jgi:hypothetical protein
MESIVPFLFSPPILTMSIEAPQGILNIPNATLRVGRLEISEVVGADTALNTIARNTILLVDGETYHENKNWGLKLPNAWAGEFECNTASAGNYSEFNFYNEGASSNAQGYNLTFNDTTVELRYDGTLLKTGTLPSTVTGTGVKKVRLMFERTILSVTVDGTLIFTHDDTGGPRPRVYSTTAGGFLNFFTDGGALKNLKIVNEKWISDGTSNIAYVGGGEVAVGQSLNLQQVSNTSMIKMNSNVVTEFPRSKKLIKYPRVAMTDYTSGGYTVEVSTDIFNSFSYNGWRLFNNAPSGWHTGESELVAGNSFNGDDFKYNRSRRLAPETPLGEYAKLTLPHGIKVEYVVLQAISTTSSRSAEDFEFWGSDTGVDGSWNLIKSFTGQLQSDTGSMYGIYANRSYKYLGFIVTRCVNNSSFILAELEYYGTPEYDPEAHGTDVVVKSYPNVPNTDWLEVYYDAKGLATGAVDSSISGLGGTTISATKLGDPQVSNDAFVFDGSGDVIVSGATSLSGNPQLSYSVWFKTNSILSGTQSNSIVMIGHAAGDKSLGFRIKGLGETIKPGNYRFYVYGGATNESVDTDIKAEIGTWTHATIVYDGLNSKLYMDGKFTVENTNTTTDLALDSGAKVALGNYINSSGAVTTISANDSYDGSIANFRLFNRALTSDEIYQLYAYQKEDFGHGDLSMTLKAGRLGIGTSEPRATLDVRGDVILTGNFSQIITGIGRVPIMGRISNTFLTTSPSILISNLPENVDIDRMKTAAYGAIVMMSGGNVSGTGNRARGSYMFMGEVSQSSTHIELAYGFFDGTFTKVAGLRYDIGSDSKSITVYQTLAQYHTGDTTNRYDEGTWTTVANPGSTNYGVKDLTIFY